MKHKVTHEEYFNSARYLTKAGALLAAERIRAEHHVARSKIILSDIRKIIQQYPKKKGVLIPLLQDIQAIYGYVPEESIELISKELSIYPVEIYGILTFYTQFYFTQRGRYSIKVCRGTCCHVMGGEEILRYISNKLGISVGETTEDGIFSLERVACLGCCGMAPVVAINNDFYGKCTIQKVEKILDKCQAVVVR